MFKNLIINKIKSNLSKIHNADKIIELENARSLLFLFEISDLPIVQNLANLLDKEGKKSCFIVYSEALETTLIPSQGFIFSNKDLTFWKFPKPLIITKFLKEADEADILIDLTTTNYLPISYLISISEVKLKVGIKKEGFDLYDFMIDDPKNMDLKFLSEKIMFYLRRLKS